MRFINKPEDPKVSLIAFDMDETLLNSEKQVSEKTQEAMKRAADAGLVICLSTGRSLAELSDYLYTLPGLQYAICVSGAMIYDVKNRKVISSGTLSVDSVKKILEEGAREDVMFQLLSVESVVQEDQIPRMAYYGMEQYIPLYEKVSTKVRDTAVYYKEHPLPQAKVNIYHHTTEARERTRERLEKLMEKDSSFRLEIKYAEKTSLECSGKGVNKGRGLVELCRYLNLSLEETVAVGDAPNDLDILKIAGIAAAVENAKEEIRACADVILADCDHDGCAEILDWCTALRQR